MTPLTVRLKQYIAIRRSLGFDLLFAERVLAQVRRVRRPRRR